MNETNYWYCDKCGKKIDNIEEGWVEWLVYGDTNAIEDCRRKNMRIVHHARCNYTNNEIENNKAILQEDCYLSDFSGADGLMTLLGFISLDEFDDRENILEIIKRIHIPGYEEARCYFDEALSNQVIDYSTHENYYMQYNIKKILDYKNNKSK